MLKPNRNRAKTQKYGLDSRDFNKIHLNPDEFNQILMKFIEIR